MMSLFLFGVSMGEVLVVLLAVLLLFGSKSIPEFARTLGKGMNEFKKATDDLKKEFQEGTSGIMDDVKKIQSDIQSEINQSSNALREFANDIEHEDYSTHLGTQSNVNNDDVYGLNEESTENTSTETSLENPEAPLNEAVPETSLEDKMPEEKIIQ